MAPEGERRVSPSRSPFGARFLVQAASCALGLLGFALLPLAWGIAAMIACWIAGGIYGERVFRRYASLDQIKADLRDRVDNND